MSKDELIKRAKYNGMMSAKCNFEHDHRTGKTYSENTKDLARSYSMFKDEIYDAHNAAYAEFSRTHKH